MRSGQELNRFAAQVLFVDEGGDFLRQYPVRAVAFSPNGMLLARGDNGEVFMTSTDSSKEVSRLRGYSQLAGDLSVSRDNRFNTTGNATGGDKGAALWDHQTGRPSSFFPGERFSTVEFSPMVQRW